MIYKYEFKNLNEKEIIEKYFNIFYSDNTIICFTYDSNIKLKRKIKLLMLRQDELSKILKQILDNSSLISASDAMEMKLSQELAKEIDKQILEKLKNMNFSYTMKTGL